MPRSSPLGRVHIRRDASHSWYSAAGSTPPTLIRIRWPLGISATVHQPGLALLAQAKLCLQDRFLPEALGLFYDAERAGADRCLCASSRWETLMLMGNFEAAWRESDMLRVLDPSDVHRLWRGESITGKRVIVRCLHGLGDALHFLRYAAQLQSRVNTLFVQVAPTLVPLARCIRGVDQVVTWDELSPDPAPSWDVQIEVMQLPYLFRSTLATIPSSIPYLDLPASLLKSTATRMSAASTHDMQPRIGLCWSSGEWNPTRAITQQLFERIVRDHPGQYYSLQKEPPDVPFKMSHPESTWHESAAFGSGPLCLASVVAHLDLVITVDTMVAHLAGALGKPVWLLLQHAADWRWMHPRTDSPWYPTMHIFRQSQQGNWISVVEEVAAALATFAQPIGRSPQGTHARLE